MHQYSGQPPVNRILQAGLSLLYPPVCVFCNQVCQPDEQYPGICRGCLAHLPLRSGRAAHLDWRQLALLSNLVDLTGRPIPAGSAIYCASRYQGVIREALLKLKFDDRPDIAVGLASLLIQVIGRLGLRPQAVAAVPLHRSRLRERGYNQSALITDQIASHLEIPNWSAHLSRNRATERQSALGSRQERAMNLASAFTLEAPAAPPPGHPCGAIILVDDILTTGATLTAAAGPFWQIGVPVTGLVVASEQNPAPSTGWAKPSRTVAGS
jgi:ComF family protein